MARRKPRNYKQVDAFTKDVGSSGGQIRCLSIYPLDAGVASGYLNNIQLTLLLNDSPEGEIGGFIAYITLSSSWDDDDILTARGGNFGDTVSLTAKRPVRESNSVQDGMGGSLHVWVELTDITATDNVDVRVIAETWGRFLSVVEV